MKEINTTTIEQALALYKETVSPETNCLHQILSHIPERKVAENRPAIRSPYTRLAITELVMLCSIVLAVVPTLLKIFNDPFYKIDKKVQIFEKKIQIRDFHENLANVTL